MDYSKIHIAKRVLELGGIDVPENEEEMEIRNKAYEHLAKKDFLAAHSIRLGKDYRVFSKEEWQEVMRISGKDAVSSNMGAFALCKKYELI